ncbi:hypothetical protein DEO72_LG2g2700 [Vigna unguiculata]|uniref:Uncharacterized protein n=1 Tax=Vigna unguiculata TaxID=3917 RepID=A0A4D6L1L6_VIGUN|nr:hypothetical protein DEO72_LG2g2700 [Vigna unguiculata]
MKSHLTFFFPKLRNFPQNHHATAALIDIAIALPLPRRCRRLAAVVPSPLPQWVGVPPSPLSPKFTKPIALSLLTGVAIALPSPRRCRRIAVVVASPLPSCDDMLLEDNYGVRILTGKVTLGITLGEGELRRKGIKISLSFIKANLIQKFGQPFISEGSWTQKAKEHATHEELSSWRPKEDSNRSCLKNVLDVTLQKREISWVPRRSGFVFLPATAFVDPDLCFGIVLWIVGAVTLAGQPLHCSTLTLILGLCSVFPRPLVHRALILVPEH